MNSGARYPALIVNLIPIALVSAFLLIGRPLPAPVNVALALFLVLFLPGYALMSALSLGGERANQLILVLGLSLSAVVVSAPVLNVLPGGLTARSWATLLCTITVVAALATLLKGFPPAERRRLMLSPPLMLGGLIAMLFAGGALGIAVLAADRQRHAGFTELWMLQVPTRQTVSVGVVNETRSARTYTVVIASSTRRVRRWTNIDLSPGQSWTHSFALTINMAGSRAITCRLFVQPRAGRAYRSVRLVLT